MPFAIDDPNPLQALRAVMQRLRDKEHGCPWDVQQDFQSVAPFTVEEAHEVADAISRNDMVDLQEELGDVLLQVVFHSQMAEEQQLFNFDDVARGIVEKMIRRHPHVFAGQKYADQAEQSRAWAAMKQAERAEKAQRKLALAATAMPAQPAAMTSSFSEIGRGLPEMQRAMRLQAKAAEFGFDWPSVQPVFDKLSEEINELDEAMREKDRAEMHAELGDVLFVLCNIARHLKLDPGQALRSTNTKFESRFARMEQLATAQGKVLSELDLQQQDALWDQAKRIEQGRTSAEDFG